MVYKEKMIFEIGLNLFIFYIIFMKLSLIFIYLDGDVCWVCCGGIVVGWLIVGRYWKWLIGSREGMMEC